MITPIVCITLKDSERLRRKPAGTNGRLVRVTRQEVEDMKKHLDDVYLCDVTYTFAEKICKNNKVYWLIMELAGVSSYTTKETLKHDNSIYYKSNRRLCSYRN